MTDLYDLAEQALLRALDDGEINVNDFPKYKKFKRQSIKELRQLFADIEDEGIEVSREAALLALALLALVRR